MTQVGCVDADLVGAPGARAGFEEGNGKVVRQDISLQNTEIGEGGCAIGVNALFEMNPRGLHAALAEEWRIDRGVCPRGMTADEGEIGFFHIARGHGGGEETCGGGVFGDEHEAAGLAVQPVDDGDLPAIGNFVGE